MTRKHLTEGTTYIGILSDAPMVILHRHADTTVTVLKTDIAPRIMARARYQINGKPAYLAVYAPGVYTVTTMPEFRNDAAVRVRIDYTVYAELTKKERPESWGSRETQDEDSAECGVWRTFSMGR